MIYWFTQVGIPLPTLKELVTEIKKLKNLQELTGIYAICWEEFVYDLDRQMNTENGWSEIAQEINELGSTLGRDIKFYVTTSSDRIHNPPPFDENDYQFRNIKILYVPNFLFLRTQYRLGSDIYPQEPFSHELKQNYYHNLQTTGLDITDVNTGLDVSNIKYSFIYMTLFPKFHRAMVMDYLAKHDLIEKGAVSWRDYNRNLDRSTIPDGVLDSQHNIGNEPFPWRYWTPKRMFLDQHSDTPGPIQFDWLPQEYSQSFMSIIGESLENDPFFSEKTAVPLMFNKPFLIAGGRHSHAFLKELGFDLYDEIFDYSFDNEINLKKRIEGLVLEVKKLDQKLKEHGAQVLLDTIKTKLVKNKMRAHEITIDKNYIPREIFDFFQGSHQLFSRGQKITSDPSKHFPYFEYAEKFYNNLLKR